MGNAFNIAHEYFHISLILCTWSVDAHRCEMSVGSCEFMEFVYVLEKRWAANLSHAVMVEIYSYTVVAFMTHLS
jgi:hypothetical protein